MTFKLKVGGHAFFRDHKRGHETGLKIWIQKLVWEMYNINHVSCRAKQDLKFNVIYIKFDVIYIKINITTLIKLFKFLYKSHYKWPIHSGLNNPFGKKVCFQRISTNRTTLSLILIYFCHFSNCKCSWYKRKQIISAKYKYLRHKKCLIFSPISLILRIFYYWRLNIFYIYYIF